LNIKNKDNPLKPPQLEATDFETDNITNQRLLEDNCWIFVECNWIAPLPSETEPIEKV